MLPAFAVYKMFERVPERFSKTFFRLLLVRIGESAKEVPSLQVLLFREPDFSSDSVYLLQFAIALYKFQTLFLVG